jgi:hypothetical protein
VERSQDKPKFIRVTCEFLVPERINECPNLISARVVNFRGELLVYGSSIIQSCLFRLTSKGLALRLPIHSDNIESSLSVPRLGHSMVQFEDKLVIYGGSPPRFDRRKRVHISYHPIIYNLRREKFEDKPSSSFFVPALRSHHTCEVVGLFMIVHGGVSLVGEILSDLLFYDL